MTVSKEVRRGNAAKRAAPRRRKTPVEAPPARPAAAPPPSPAPAENPSDAAKGSTLPNFQRMADNFALAMEHGGKALAAMIRPVEEGHAKPTAAEDLTEAIKPSARSPNTGCPIPSARSRPRPTFPPI